MYSVFNNDKMHLRMYEAFLQEVVHDWFHKTGLRGVNVGSGRTKRMSLIEGKAERKLQIIPRVVSRSNKFLGERKLSDDQGGLD